MKRFIAVVTVIMLGLVLSQGGRMQRMNAGQMTGPMMQGQGIMSPMMGQGGFLSSLHDEIAVLLGVTRDEPFALRQEGNALAAIVEELGANIVDITSQLVLSRNKTIDEALANGTIDQPQAERMRARSETLVTAMLNRNMGFGSSMPMNMMTGSPCPFHGQMMMANPAWNR
jgi:hypothetical protein